MKKENFAIRPATAADVPIILELIRALATYERAPNDVTATEDGLSKVLFGEKPAAKFCSRLKMKRQSALRFSFTIFRPGSAGRDFISRTYSLGRKIAAK